MKAVLYDRWNDEVVALSPLRERRLLTMARSPGHDHKRFYSQYCLLIRRGLIYWSLGTAFLTATGLDRLNSLCAEVR